MNAFFRRPEQDRLIKKYGDILTRRTFDKQEFLDSQNLFGCAYFNGKNYIRLFEHIFAVDEEYPIIGEVLNRENGLNLIQEVHREHAGQIIDNLLKFIPNGTKKLVMGSDVCGLFIINQDIEPVDFSIVEEHYLDTNTLGLKYKVQPAIFTQYSRLTRGPLFILDHTKVGSDLIMSLDSDFTVLSSSR